MSTVSASQFKAKLGKYIKAVRAGGAVVITDRGIPVARLEAVQPTRPTTGPVVAPLPTPDPAAPPLGKLTVKGIAYRGTDSLSLLRADRRR